MAEKADTRDVMKLFNLPNLSALVYSTPNSTPSPSPSRTDDSYLAGPSIGQVFKVFTVGALLLSPTLVAAAPPGEQHPSRESPRSPGPPPCVPPPNANGNHKCSKVPGHPTPTTTTTPTPTPTCLPPGGPCNVDTISQCCPHPDGSRNCDLVAGVCV